MPEPSSPIVSRPAPPPRGGAARAFLGRPSGRALGGLGWLLLPTAYLLACHPFQYVCWLSATGWGCVGVGLWRLVAGRRPWLGVPAGELSRRHRLARGLVVVGALLVCVGSGTDLGLWLTRDGLG